jgi:hypothetical protein
MEMISQSRNPLFMLVMKVGWADALAALLVRFANSYSPRIAIPIRR